MQFEIRMDENLYATFCYLNGLLEFCDFGLRYIEQMFCGLACRNMRYRPTFGEANEFVHIGILASC